MRFDALLTFPAQQVGALLAEAWGAFRRSSAYPDVPSLAPSLGLLGEALVDRTFTLMTSAMVGVPLPEAVRRMVDDLIAAHAFYAASGWLADPLGYHRAPPPVTAVERRSGKSFAGTRLMKYEHVSFPSGWAPHEGEPARERWLAHPRERTRARARAPSTGSEPRPWLVGVHGFGMGTPLVELRRLPAAAAARGARLNLGLPVLPLHGPRGVGGVSGRRGARARLPAHGAPVRAGRLGRAAHRSRGSARASGHADRALRHLARRATCRALVAAFEDELACVVAGIPAGRLSESRARQRAARSCAATATMRGSTGTTCARRRHAVSPLAFAPRVPRERRFIFAGIADRVAQPDQARALWRHWERCEIHWFSGGHVLGIWNDSIRDFLANALETSGLVS